jgi:hypothetical protein
VNSHESRQYENEWIQNRPKYVGAAKKQTAITWLNRSAQQNTVFYKHRLQHTDRYQSETHIVRQAISCADVEWPDEHLPIRQQVLRSNPGRQPPHDVSMLKVALLFVSKRHNHQHAAHRFAPQHLDSQTGIERTDYGVWDVDRLFSRQFGFKEWWPLSNFGNTADTS